MIITTTQEHVEVPGGKADKPTEIPARGWLQVAKRGWKEARRTTCSCSPLVSPSTRSWPSFRH